MRLLNTKVCSRSDERSIAEVITGTGRVELTGFSKLLALMLMLVLVACGEAENTQTTQNAETVSVSEFQTTVYPLLLSYCSECHGASGPDGTPDFAHDDVSIAVTAIQTHSLVNLSNASESRLVSKLLNETHNCNSFCSDWANEFTLAIQNWAAFGDAPEDEGGNGSGSQISSSTESFADYIQGGVHRVEDSVIAQYEFKTGSGQTAYDTSGVSPSLNLALSSGVNWSSGGGIEITDNGGLQTAKLLGTAAESKKLFDLIAGPVGSRQYTIEAWIQNARNDLAGPARIVSYSVDSRNRNFAMEQRGGEYGYKNRSNLSSSNGSPTLVSSGNDLTTQLQHLIFTFTESSGRIMYVNGNLLSYNMGTSDTAVPADISNWNESYRFVLGNEIPDSSPRQWLGKMLFVAIHDRALTATEAFHNSQAGLDPVYEVQFDVSAVVDPSGFSRSYIIVKVRELDSDSYEFSDPTIITSIPSPEVPIKNIRIAVNGTIVENATGFSEIDTTVTVSPTQLSSNTIVIPKDLGPDTDNFSLVFEVLGSAVSSM